MMAAKLSLPAAAATMQLREGTPEHFSSLTAHFFDQVQTQNVASDQVAAATKDKGAAWSGMTSNSRVHLQSEQDEVCVQENVASWLQKSYDTPRSQPDHTSRDTQMAVMVAGPRVSTASCLGSYNCGSHGSQGNHKDWEVSELCDRGQVAEAVDALELLVRSGDRVSSTLFYNVIKRCFGQRDKIVLGQRVHALAVKSGYESHTFLANHFMRMYSSVGNLEEVKNVFSKVEVPDSFMWSSIILSHTEHGQPKQAVELYLQMRSTAAKPDAHVFVAALGACASASDLRSGRQVHADVLKSGLKPNVYIGSSLIAMYAKCGRVEDARQVFDSISAKNVVVWNSMIHGYTEHGMGSEALALYERMEWEGTTFANKHTFSCLLMACASVGGLEQGKKLHSRILDRGLEADVFVGSCVVDMYCKCGSLEDAQTVFDRLPTKNVVTWTALIAGYAKHGLGQEALALYRRVEQEGMVVVNNVTLVCLLKACEGMGALQQGRYLHAQIAERGLEADVLVGSCLVDMYAKCGSLDDARRVFDKLPDRNVVTWTAMLNGFAQINDGQKAMQCFEDMLQEGVQPDETTFLCLLVACSHEGLLEEGRQYFKAMVEDHSIVPTRKHYLCMVDLLGRSGHLDEAEEMMMGLSSDSNIVGWMSLLNACRCYGDVERGRRCFESLIRLDPQNPSSYVLMAKLYADAGRWADVDRVEGLRKLVGAIKKPAKAGIEVKNQVHTFVVGEGNAGISSKSRSINLRLREGGHVPQTQLVLKPATTREKEDELCGHAEKLALAYGLLNTPDGTPLLVTKNLRMCGDCHSASEIMSRIESRKIIVRDSHRVHRFQAGSCSCRGRP